MPTTDYTELNPTTPLQHEVNDWYTDQQADGYTSCLEDLAKHGCVSGMVGDLIYHTDTLAFYLKHRTDIDAMAYEMADDCGISVADLFSGGGWDPSDPFARDTTNQNILAWFGFEETARNLAATAGLDL